MNPNAVVSLVIFAFTFILILSEKLHRTVAALLGSVLMVIVGNWMGFYTEADAIHSIDMETIGLLFGMMILIALLEETGFFEYVAIRAARASGGNPWILMVSLGSITTVLSMFLDNVTTVVLIAPVTILITNLLGLNPIPYLIGEALLSNTGGTATLVGDPPNIMIGSAAKLSFLDFILHMGPQVLVAWLAALIVLLVVFRKILSRKPRNLSSLMKVDLSSVLKHKKNAKKLLWVLALVILLFFLSDPLHLRPWIVAIMGATLGFLLVRPKVEEICKTVEWPVLIFFAALFVTVGGLKHSGVLSMFAYGFVGLAKENLLLCCVLLIWVSAVASAIVDNIPFTMAMIPVIQHIEAQGIAVAPLWWALALGVGFGGNGTPIGSTANVVVVSLSEKTRKPITTGIWLRSGLLVMLATCAAVTVTFIIFFKFMQ